MEERNKNTPPTTPSRSPSPTTPKVGETLSPSTPPPMSQTIIGDVMLTPEKQVSRTDRKPELVSTPFHPRLDTSERFVAGVLFSQDFRHRLQVESIEAVVRGMPATEFLETYLPWKRGRRHRHRLQKGDLTVHTSETSSYEKLVRSLNSLNLRTLRFVNTSNKPNNDFVVDGLRPDISCYPKHSNEKGTNFGLMEFWIELKSRDDPFKGVEDTTPDTLKAKDIVGQLMSYAVPQLTSGFWTHCFSVFVFGHMARLIRWDRAGAIVTEAFDIQDESNLLLDFCQRYDQSTPEQRGHDQSVCVPKTKDRETAFTALTPIRGEGEEESAFNKRKADIVKEKLVEYLVNDTVTGAVKRFIGPPPKKQIMSLQGRSTRGCPVYDVESGKVCYLKDTWRVDSPELMKEGDTYTVLHQNKVSRIAGVVAHGDLVPTAISGSRADTSVSNRSKRGSIPPYTSQCTHPHINNHITQTDKLCKSDWTIGPCRPQVQGYVHYRLVLNVVGRDLTSFKSSKEVLRVFIDALTAHGEAYTKAGILHRDISLGNIVITADGRGVLIDWDLSKPNSKNSPRAIGRTGTWQFISGALLQDPKNKCHVYSDDLESFLHVITYALLRFTPSNWDHIRVRNYLKKTFDELEEGEIEDGVALYRGGSIKAGDLGRAMYIADLEFTGRKGLAVALRGISWMFRYIYIGKGFGMADEVLIREREILNRYRDGGESFKTKLKEVLEEADDWKDGPAMFVDLPPTISEVERYQRKILQLQFPTSYNSLAEEGDDINTTNNTVTRPSRRRRLI